MRKTKSETPPPPDIPEVAELKRRMQDLQDFKAAYADVFERYGELAEAYDAALDAADKAVRGRNLRTDVGPFHYLHTVVKYNANALYEELGQEAFQAFGGTMKTVVEYGIDGKRFDIKAATGALDPETVRKVRREIPHFRAPKKIEGV